MTRPNTIEVTDAEIVAAGNDYLKAVALKEFARNREAAAATRNKIAPVEPSPWRVEASSAEIADAMNSRGWDYGTAKTRLEEELRRDARHLDSAMASASAEISEALEAAAAAKLLADNLLAEKSAILDSMASRLSNLGAFRLKIERVKALELSKSDEAALAKTALDGYLLNAASPSPRNASVFQSALSELSLRKAITPHVSLYVGELEKIAAALVKEIKATALTEKLDVRAVLFQMEAAPEKYDQFQNWKNAGSFNDLPNNY